MLGLVAVFGLVVGSFLNVVILRTPAGESVVVGRSHCTSCGETLSWWENVPLVSWLALRGKCSHCRFPISARYPLIESSTMVVWMLLWRLTSPGDIADISRFVLLASSASILLAATWTDLDTGLIPNTLTLPSTLITVELVILCAILAPNDVGFTRGAVVGAVAYTLPIALFAAFGGMGMGDAKLAPLLGMTLGALGSQYLVVGMIAPWFLALPQAIRVMRASRRAKLVFGPALAAGWLIAVIAGPQIVRLWLRA